MGISDLSEGSADILVDHCLSGPVSPALFRNDLHIYVSSGPYHVRLTGLFGGRPSLTHGTAEHLVTNGNGDLRPIDLGRGRNKIFDYARDETSSVQTLQLTCSTFTELWVGYLIPPLRALERVDPSCLLW